MTAGVLLVGCGTRSEQLPPAPGIEDARDARGADPCGMLPPDRLAALGFDAPGTPGSAPEGPRCEWRGDGGGLEVTLYVDGGGLATLARNSEQTTTRVRVAGYPALETFTGRGEFCQYDVGIADTQVVALTLDAPGPPARAATTPDACSLLQGVIPAVVGNLPSLLA